MDAWYPETGIYEKAEQVPLPIPPPKPPFCVACGQHADWYVLANDGNKLACHEHSRVASMQGLFVVSINVLNHAFTMHPFHVQHEETRRL